MAQIWILDMLLAYIDDLILLKISLAHHMYFLDVII